MNEAHVRQNLIDAGCDSATINDFFKIVGAGQFEKRLMLLRKHRKNYWTVYTNGSMRLTVWTI